MLPIVQSPRLRPAGILLPQCSELHLNENEPLVNYALNVRVTFNQDARVSAIKIPCPRLSDCFTNRCIVDYGTSTVGMNFLGWNAAILPMEHLSSEVKIFL
jgi:hypothetical protein